MWLNKLEKANELSNEILLVLMEEFLKIHLQGEESLEQYAGRQMTTVHSTYMVHPQLEGQ